MKPRSLPLMVALALASTGAAAASGSFTFVTGQVSLTKANGQRVDAVRGTEVDPGDLVATGTPSGVGMGMTPPRWLKSGDSVRIAIDGLGEIENRFVEG